MHGGSGQGSKQQVKHKSAGRTKLVQKLLEVVAVKVGAAKDEALVHPERIDDALQGQGTTSRTLRV